MNSSRSPQQSKPIYDYIIGAVLSFGFILILVTAADLPIYTDEITSRAIYARYFLDGNKLIYLFASCSSSFLMDMPFLFGPAYLIQSLLYSDLSSPYKLRVIGILAFCIWLISSNLIVRIISDKTIQSLHITIFLIASCSCGLMPYLAIINRPEAEMLIYINLAIGLGLVKQHGKSNLAQVAQIPAFLILSNLFFSAHPKSLLFLPLFIFTALRLTRNLILKSTIILALLFTAAQSYVFFTTRNSCPENPELNDVFNGELITPQDIVRSPGTAILRITENLSRFYEFSEGSFYRSNTESNWFPLPDQFYGNRLLPVLLNEINFWIFSAGFVVIIAAFCHICMKLWLGRLNYLQHVILYVTAGLLAVAALQGSRSFYECRFHAQLQIILLLLIYSNYKSALPRFEFRNIIACFLLSMVLVEQSYKVSKFNILPNFWENMQASESTRFTVSGSGYQKTTRKLDKLHSECRLPGLLSSNQLVVDEWTYPFLSSSYRPVFVTYLFLWDWYSIKTNDKLEFLYNFITDNNYDGFMIGCHWLTTNYFQNLISNGEFCCWRNPNKMKSDLR